MLRHIGGAMALNLASSAFSVGSTSSNDSSEAIPTHILESLVPGFGTARSIIWTYTSIDITYIVTWCVLLIGLGSAARYIGEFVYEYIILQYCVATVSVQANERLNDEILSFMSAHVVERGSRFVAAQSARSGNDNIVDPYSYSRSKRPRLTKDDYDERTPPIKYFPALGTHWFWFRGRLFMFQRGQFTIFSRTTRSLYTDFARGGEPLVIMRFGRSLGPVKDFIRHCKEYAEEAKKSMTAVHVKGDKYRYPDTWGQTVMRPARSLDSINMDEQVKREIVRDVDAYMHPSARQFYGSRGIPFRRGYLFHGPPGTGKTSFSLALAGHCKLDLYMLSLANGSLDEDDLNRMFALLPPRCVVLLEDIDSAGIKRESDEDDEDTYTYRSSKQISLSGLLNAIDGTSSQEGRILIMTSNHPEKLDPALVRPGRIDKKIYFGYINKGSARELYMRMFSADGREEGADIGLALIDEKVEDIDELADKFAEAIPPDVLTPAELQGFLLAHRSSPNTAVAQVDAWVQEELELQDKKRKADEERARKKARRKAKRAKKALEALEDEIDAEDEAEDGRSVEGDSSSTKEESTSENDNEKTPVKDVKAAKGEEKKTVSGAPETANNSTTSDTEASAAGNGGASEKDDETSANGSKDPGENSTQFDSTVEPKADEHSSGNTSDFDELSTSDVEGTKDRE